MPKKNNTITFNFVGDFTPSTKNDLLTSTPVTYGGAANLDAKTEDRKSVV